MVDSPTEGVFSSGFVVNLKSSSQPKYFLAKMVQKEQSAKYWGIPQNTAALLAYALPAKSLVINEVGSDLKLSFSLLGITKAREHIMKSCSAGKELLEEDFESEFLTSQVKSLDLTKMTTESVIAMRTLYYGGFGVYLRLLKIKKQIADLNEQSAQVIKGLQGVLKLSEKSKTTLAQLESRRIQLKEERLNLMDQMQRARQEVSVLIAYHVKAMEQAEKANVDLAAIKPGHDILVNRISSAEARVTDIQRSIDQNEDAKANLHQAIVETDNEIASLQSENSQSYDRIHELERQVLYFENRYDRFNVRVEAEGLQNDNSNFRDIYYSYLPSVERQMNVFDNHIEKLRPSLRILRETARDWGCTRRHSRGDDDFNEDDSFGNGSSEDCRRLRLHGRDHFEAHRYVRQAYSDLDYRRNEYIVYLQDARRYIEELASNFKYWLSSRALEFRQSIDQERQNINYRESSISQQQSYRTQLVSQLTSISGDSSLHSLLRQSQIEHENARGSLGDYKRQSDYDAVLAAKNRAASQESAAARALKAQEEKIVRLGQAQGANERADAENQAATEKLLSEIASLEQEKMSLDQILVPYFEQIDGTIAKAGLKAQLAKGLDDYAKASLKYSERIQ